jgi:inhibitor of KinA
LYFCQNSGIVLQKGGKAEMNENQLVLRPMGDSAIVAELGQKMDQETHFRVKALAAALKKNPFRGMTGYVPAFTTLTVFYDPLSLSFTEMSRRLQSLAEDIGTGEELQPKVVEIPVCYGGEFGPDLPFVAEYNKLSPEEVIRIHASGEYLVYMIGFAPGFPYLGGMSERIAAPRKPSPRVKVPAGSVGIAGKQTGIYSLDSPGGWQLIGRTPLSLFRVDRNPPGLLEMGDIVRFRPISRAEYERWEAGGNHAYQR